MHSPPESSSWKAAVGFCPQGPSLELPKLIVGNQAWSSFKRCEHLLLIPLPLTPPQDQVKGSSQEDPGRIVGKAFENGFQLKSLLSWNHLPQVPPS